MARKKARSVRPSPASRRVLAHFTRMLLTLAVVAAGAAAVLWFGSRAGERVLDDPRYAVRFADIHCDVPHGLTREVFLSEVRYLADAPETVQAVDPALTDGLASLFRRHPWVADVNGVEVTAERVVHVRLTFRVPVLLVQVMAGEPGQRLVDVKGVLLPPTRPPDGVAVLANSIPPPRVPAGQVWDDPTVKRAAELAREFNAVRVERTERGWRVTQASGRVLSVSW